MAPTRITFIDIGTSGNRLYLETKLKDEGKEGFTLTVLDGENVWEGQISEDDLDQDSTDLKMDFDTYVSETKAAFTQEGTADQNFEVYLKPAASSAQLSWKKVPTQDIKYHLGSVTLKKCLDPAAKICDIFRHCIAHAGSLQAQQQSLEADNERLTLERQNALKRLDKCVTAKEELEKDLYSKFVLVLNSKKERISELTRQTSSGSPDESADSPVPSTSRQDSGSLTPAKRHAANKNGVGSNSKSDSVSDGYDVDTDNDSPPPKQKKSAIPKKMNKLESSLKLSDDEDDDQESNMKPVARRPQRQKATKKQTPSKPTLPRVTSRNKAERAGDASRRESLRKGGSGASNKSSDNIDPDDLMDNF